MQKWLKSLGRVGETLAWILALIETKITWGAFWAIVIGSAVAAWTWAITFLSDQKTQIGIGVALICFWTYVGFRVLKYLQNPIRTMPALDYRYCISPEGLIIGVDPNNNDRAVSFIFSLRNVGSGPIRLQVKKFDVRIEDRAVPEPEKEMSVVIPRAGVRMIRSAGFKSDIIKNQNTGSVDMLLIYGDPDGKFERAYKFKARLNFIFTRGDDGKLVQAAVSEENQAEEEYPYKE